MVASATLTGGSKQVLLLPTHPRIPFHNGSLQALKGKRHGKRKSDHREVNNIFCEVNQNKDAIKRKIDIKNERKSCLGFPGKQEADRGETKAGAIVAT